ncbi:winged helix-turn-helix transcriptional regulator [Actinoplanes couchii]|uniref:Transcriptional regulator n=1 Tax=Actinoplanes couchii TaxID=403638 RepID=A0ABQ3XH62_9ACTN|nr:helix-turn-helix domain-containing protein [Actinoplanes couchii]MDR6320703.1 DNA-binding HxlR family transcriptional regulator [Actinoplanes couchii]GID57811.1 transcriptional regulator [Actinoplanes couchii]
MAAHIPENRRAEHRQAMAECPGHRVLTMLGNRWVSLILKALGDGPRRHGDLSRAVPGASQKMLTQTLRGLERDGLLRRDEAGYTLTPLGAGLLDTMNVVVGWANVHMAASSSANRPVGTGASSGQ